jgi:hypothetical protein
VLQTQLDAQLADALDGIDRHVARHRDVRSREILSARQRLIERSAALEHNNEAKLAGLAEANADAAQMRARLDGSSEKPAMQGARSAVWRSAIGELIASGQGPKALRLFDRAKEHLTSADQRALDVPIQATRMEATADAWIAREQDSPGEPLGSRSRADPHLSDAEKATTLAKIEARDSARESARVATVKGLDDAFEAASDAVASTPGTYRPGTLAALANAYEDADEPTTANFIRRLAERESFLLSFARSSAEAQQRLIDNLPEGEERSAAKAIQERQNEVFAKDAFAAGTALYPNVGPPKPIDDIEGRLAQARTIGAYRGVDVLPFTTAEIAVMRPELTPAVYQPGRDPLVEDLLTLVDVRDNKRQGDAARDAEIERIRQVDPRKNRTGSSSVRSKHARGVHGGRYHSSRQRRFIPRGLRSRDRRRKNSGDGRSKNWRSETFPAAGGRAR